MVMLYQGSNQSMDDPPQNQEHDDIVDPAPYLARDSASDWRPRGGGIMTMNNQGFEESNMGFEESMEMTTCFYFPPSPTNFPLYRPMPSVFFVSSEQKNISLAFSCQHILELEDKSGALHVLNWEDGQDIIELLFGDLKSYMDSKFDAVPKGVESLVDNILREENYDEKEVILRRIRFEQDDVDIVDQPVFELVAVVQQQIQNRGGELDVILGGGVLTINGLEQRDSQGSPTIPEPLLILQAKVSCRMWLAHDGQWAFEIRCKCNRLNIGNFTTVEDAISAYEVVARLGGWKDLTCFAGLFENENRSKLPLQVPLIAQELNPIGAVGTGSEGTGDCIMADQARLNSRCLGKRKTKEKNPGGERRSKKTNGVRIAIPPEDILQTKGMSFKEAANHLGAEAVGIGSGGTEQSEMEEGQLNSRYLGKEKRKEMTPRGERRNKETSGVRIAISLEEILQTKEMPLKDAAKHLKVSKSTLKRACREYDIPRWPPRGEHKLISQSCPNESPAVVDKEPIRQLNSDTLLPYNQVSATIGTKSVIVKARFGSATMKFQLSWPWGTKELKEQVKKRLGHEAENYYINYKDEDNEYILIGCDEDLQDHISRSNLLGTNLIEVFLQPKPK